MAKAYYGDVEIAGKKYQTRGQIYKQRVVEWPEAAPASTEQTRDTRRYLQTWLIDTIRSLMAANDFDGSLKMCYDSYIDTRWPGQLTLPPLWETTTGFAKEDIAEPADNDYLVDLIGPANLAGYVHCCWPALSSSNHCIKTGFISTSTGTFTGVEDMVTPDATYTYQPFDLIEHAGYLICLYVHNGEWKLRRKTLGTAWTDPVTGGGNWLGSLYGAGDYGLLCSVNDRLFGFFWDDNTRKIRSQWSADAGETWSVLEMDAGYSSMPPMRALTWQDGDGVAKPTLCCAEGVIQLDYEGINPKWIFKEQVDVYSWNGRGAIVWPTTGALYYPLAGRYSQWYLGSQECAGKLYELSWQNGALVTRDVGFDQGARLATGRNGPIQFLQYNEKFLFALVSSGTNETTGVRCGVLAFDGQGWHHMLDSTWSSGCDYGSSDKPLMIVLAHNGLTLFWEESTHLVVDGSWCRNVTDNPLSPTFPTYYYFTENGTLVLPIFAGGAPDVDTVWLTAKLIAEGLDADASGEYCTVTYGVDGEGYSAHTLGNFFSGTKVLEFGNGAGIPGKTLSLALQLRRASGATTSTPKVYGLAIEYLKVPTPRHYYRFTVDVNETAEGWGRTPASVMADLAAAEASIPQVTLSFPGQDQVYAKIIEPTASVAQAFGKYKSPLEAALPQDNLVDVVMLELI